MQHNQTPTATIPSSETIKKKKKTTTKSVSFAMSARMRLSRHANDYTTDELNACYYSSRNFCEFKRDIKRTLRMIERKEEQLDDIHFCQRGVVECLTKQALAIRSKHRQASRFAVLNPQLHEEFLLCVAPVEDDYVSTTTGGRNYNHQQQQETIAALYSRVVRECIEAAYQVGLADEAEIRKEEHESSLLSSSSVVPNPQDDDDNDDDNERNLSSSHRSVVVQTTDDPKIVKKSPLQLVLKHAPSKALGTTKRTNIQFGSIKINFKND